MHGEHEPIRRAGRPQAVALFLAVSFAACGGGSDDDGTGGGDGTAPTSTVAAGAEGSADLGGGAGGGGPGAGAGGGAAGGPGGSAASGGAGGGGTGGEGSSATAPKPELALRLDLADDCVRPGGMQTLTVDTEPEISVGFTARYADGKTPMQSGYHGGASAGKTDAKGHYESTWQVAATAPAGPVAVTVLAAHPSYKSTRREVTFKVSDATGNCR